MNLFWAYTISVLSPRGTFTGGFSDLELSSQASQEPKLMHYYTYSVYSVDMMHLRFLWF